MQRICFLLILSAFTGCENGNLGSGSSPLGNSDTESTDAVKAEDATGIWNESQVRQYITEELKLTSVELTSTGDGNYTATGKNAEGLQYDITIEQKPGGIRYNFTSGEGKTGSGAFGNFVES